ncbi:ribonuclease H-like domain-containing protein [Tanacetum coccineum]
MITRPSIGYYPIWCNGYYDEYNALVKNGTWILVPRPSDVNLVRSMWLFKHKFHADGTLSRYKARLVANGSNQQHGVDFDETFSPVVKPLPFRTPPSFVDSCYPNHVCLLRRSLYGLKQHLVLGSTPVQGSQVAYLLIYVDDIILTTSSPVLLQQIVDSLHKEFDMTDLGALNYFLGISVVRHPTGLFLSQKKYARQLLERAQYGLIVNPLGHQLTLTLPNLGPEEFLSSILLYIVVLQGGSSILPLLAQICPMQFNRFVFICMIRGSQATLLVSNVSCAMFKGHPRSLSSVYLPLTTIFSLEDFCRLVMLNDNTPSPRD